MARVDDGVGMDASVRNTLESFRQPEYTGENRCLPCTVINTILAVILAVAGWLLASWYVGLFVLALSVLLIGARGYLVPGTPELTKRYLPERVHRLFGTHHGEPESEYDEAFDLETFLRESEIAVECPDEADLCLEPSFQNRWQEERSSVDTLEDRLERLAARLEVDPAELALEDSMGGYAATYEGERIGLWPSEAAFLADLTVVPVLEERCPEWTELSSDEQGALITALRVFLEECPSCQGQLTGTSKTVESCCSTRTRESLECKGCGEQLFSQVS
ncbi:hypothetical protein ACLI4R_16520 [Natrialbaceae archaeon A-chndr2]